MTFDELYSIINSRRTSAPADSYVAALIHAGEDRMIQKVGEEAVEVVIAAKNRSREQTIAETADLLFHLTVLLAAHGIGLKEIMDELDRRHKQRTPR